MCHCMWTSYLCMDMWLFNIEVPCNFFVACGKLFYGFDLSFVAAYIFYLMTVHYPEAMKNRVIYAAADFPAVAIVTNIENIFVDMANKQNLKIESKDLNTERIIQFLLKPNTFLTQLHIVFKGKMTM